MVRISTKMKHLTKISSHHWRESSLNWLFQVISLIMHEGKHTFWFFLSFSPLCFAYLPPVLRSDGVVYWCPGRFSVCASQFPTSGLFSLCPAAPPSSPAPPPSLPSARACQHQLWAHDQPTLLGRQTSRLPLALQRCCCLCGCEEMGQCLTAEKGENVQKLVYSVTFSSPIRLLLRTEKSHFVFTWQKCTFKLKQ